MAALDLVPGFNLETLGKHKAMGGHEMDPDVIKTALEAGGVRTTGDIATQGALFFLPGEENPSAYVKPPGFRADEQALMSSDFGSLALRTRASTGDTTHRGTSSGGELEIYAWDPAAQDMAPIMAEGSATRAELEELREKGEIDFSDETSIFCVEINFPAGTNHAELAVESLRNLRTLGTVARKHAWAMLPVSMMPNRKLLPAEVNKNPYIQRMTFSHQTWALVQHFTGASDQELAGGLDFDSDQWALNQMQTLSTLLYGASLSSPFTHGEQKGLSGRFHSRIIGSPSGGVFEEPLPETYREYNELAAEMLRNGTIPSPARVAGHHRDRLRPDIGTHGAVESCGMDTAGGDPIRGAALKYAFKTAFWKLSYLQYENKTDQLEPWPALFHTSVTKETLATDHENHYMVAENGMAATITGADKRDYTTQELWMQFIDFLDTPIEDTDYTGLPAGIRLELILAGQTGISNSERADLVDIHSFYRTRQATLSHWLVERQKQSGQSIEDCLGNLAIAYDAHIFDPTLEERLKALF